MANHFSDCVDYLAFCLLFAYVRPLICNKGKPQKDILGILVGLHNFDQQNNVLIALEKYLLLDCLYCTCQICKKWPEVVEYGNKLLVFQMPLEKKVILLSEVGNAFSKIGNRDMAQDYLERSLNLSKQLRPDTKLEMFLSLLLAHFYFEIGEYRKSLGYFERQFEISKERHDIKQEMSACTALGVVYEKIDQNRKAIDCLQRQLEISKKWNNIDQEMKACIALGDVHGKIGEYKQAVDYIERSLKISKERHDIDREMKACNMLAIIYRAIGEFGKALGYFVRQLKISKERHDSIKR